MTNYLLMKPLIYVTQIGIFTYSKFILLKGYTRHAQSGMYKVDPNIIIANHEHANDPFAIVGSLSYKDFFALAPFCFMTANKFFDNPKLHYFALLAGCFPSHPSPRTQFSGIEMATRLVKRNYTLVMFPEGRRTEERIPAKTGIYQVLDQLDEVSIMLAHIHWNDRRIEYIRSKAITNHSLPPTVDDLMDQIYEL